MLSRLTRIFLAFAMAVVFAGQVEAATQHCVRLAELAKVAPAESPPVAETGHCHEATAADTRGGKAHHPAGEHHTGGKLAAHCQCVATTIACVIAGETWSSRVAPYSWLLPEEVRFASSKPEPDWRPPRT